MMLRSILLLFFTSTLCIPLLQSQTWEKVEAGTEFSMALKSDGTIWTWGFNGNGQLGIGSSGETVTEPMKMGEDSNWKDISTGALHSIAIKEDGTLWAWGFNYYGQLGLGSTAQIVNSPQQVGVDTNWWKIDGGVIHSIALKKDSSLWTFGSNLAGQLGHSEGDDVTIPTRVDSHKYMDISAGGFHNLAVRSDSTIWGWGDNAGLQVGSQFNEMVVTTPSLVDSADVWKGVSCGFQYSTALKHDSSLYTWGFNGNGQLGHSMSQTVGTPTMVDSVKKWRFIAAGSSFMHAILDDGSLWAWGFNGAGQLGLGGQTQQNTPVQVGLDTSWKFIADANGFFAQQSLLGLHSLGLKGDARSICVAGANYQGQLGTGTTNSTALYNCNVGDLTTSITSAPYFEAELRAYPVPADDQLTVTFVNGTSDWTFELYDAKSGLQIQRNLRPFEDFQGDISFLSPGLYYAVVRVEGEIVGRKKVVIAR